MSAFDGAMASLIADPHLGCAAQYRQGGIGAPVSPLAVISPPPGVVIGNNSIAQVDSITPDFVGLTPNFVGLYQINVRVPAQVERGNAVPLYLNFGAQVSNRVNLAIQ